MGNCQNNTYKSSQSKEQSCDLSVAPHCLYLDFIMFRPSSILKSTAVTVEVGGCECQYKQNQTVGKTTGPFYLFDPLMTSDLKDQKTPEITGVCAILNPFNRCRDLPLRHLSRNKLAAPSRWMAFIHEYLELRVVHQRVVKCWVQKPKLTGPVNITEDTISPKSQLTWISRIHLFRRLHSME